MVFPCPYDYVIHHKAAIRHLYTFWYSLLHPKLTISMGILEPLAELSTGQLSHLHKPVDSYRVSYMLTPSAIV